MWCVWPTSSGWRSFDHTFQFSEGVFTCRWLFQFQICATQSGWKNAFIGLEELKDELAVRDEAPDLSALISLSIRLTNHLKERRRERRRIHREPVSSPQSQRQMIQRLYPQHHWLSPHNWDEYSSLVQRVRGGWFLGCVYNVARLVTSLPRRAHSLLFTVNIFVKPLVHRSCLFCLSSWVPPWVFASPNRVSFNGLD